MRAAVIQSGVVVQVVVLGAQWEDPASPDHWVPPGGSTVVLSDIAGIGWTWDGSIFTAPPPNTDPLPTPEQVRAATFAALPERQDLIARLKTATPAQVDSWLTTNVTTLAQARTVLGSIIKVLCVGPPS